MGAEDFSRMMEQFPEVRRKLEAVERERMEMNPGSASRWCKAFPWITSWRRG